MYDKNMGYKGIAIPSIGISFVVILLYFFVFQENELQAELYKSDAVKYLTGRNVLSYTAFGNMTKYKKLIKEIASEATQSDFYQKWEVWFYHEGSLTTDLMNSVKLINALVHYHDVRNLKGFGNIQNKNGMIWRYVPLADDDVDIVCPRDLDSSLLSREKNAVDDWLKSKKIIHLMRDHKLHGTPILGGMFCFRNHLNRELGRYIVTMILKHCAARHPMKKIEAATGNDQAVLAKYIWPLVQSDSIQHDSYLCRDFRNSILFPTKRNETTNFHVGCVRPCRPYKVECLIQCRPKRHKD